MMALTSVGLLHGLPSTTLHCIVRLVAVDSGDGWFTIHDKLGVDGGFTLET